jgi:hypothetical protein
MRIVVLGAGIVGASAAFHLNRLGAEVFLIDRDAPGRATLAGAGIICPWLSRNRHPRFEELAFAAARYYPEVVKDLAAAGETAVEYDVVGGLIVAPSEEVLDILIERLEALLDDGVSEIGEVRLLASGGPKELFPYLDPKLAGVYLSGAARVSGENFRKALCNAAVKAGVKQLSAAATLEISGNAVVGVHSNREFVPSDFRPYHSDRTRSVWFNGWTLPRDVGVPAGDGPCSGPGSKCVCTPPIDLASLDCSQILAGLPGSSVFYEQPRLWQLNCPVTPDIQLLF